MQFNKPTRILLLIVAVATILGLVAALKKAGTGLSRSEQHDNQSNLPIAHPDTLGDPTAMPVVADTAASTTLADTLVGKDSRPANEAGFEDGYLDGMDDGALGQERASYDESSAFPTETERQRYKETYAEGYAKGFEDGVHHRQFNINKSPASTSAEEP